MFKKFLYTGLCLLALACSKNDGTWNQKEYDRILASIKEPSIPSNSVDIVSLGAVQDAFSTEIINGAIDSLSALGGGSVVIPAGTFYTAAIELKSGVNLHLEEGATLKFSTDPADYLPVVRTRWEGMDCMNYKPLIYACGAHDIAITGKGTIDGCASTEFWWPWKGKKHGGYKEGEPNQNITGRPELFRMNAEGTPIEERILGEGGYLRPQLINIVDSKNVLIEDVTLLNAPFWIVHPLFCESFIFRGVKEISNGPNSDGCDPESCKGVLIENCDFFNGDDCIAIKSGRNEDGRKWARPSEDMIIRNCVMAKGHGAITIGSEISGGARNIFVHDCSITSEEARMAVRLKTNTCRGGVIENIYIKDVDVKACGESAVTFDLVYEPKEDAQRGFYPMLRNVAISGLNVGDVKRFVTIDGLEEQTCVEDIIIKNCKVGKCEENVLIKGSTSNVVIENIDYAQ